MHTLGGISINQSQEGVGAAVWLQTTGCAVTAYTLHTRHASGICTHSLLLLFAEGVCQPAFLKHSATIIIQHIAATLACCSLPASSSSCTHPSLAGGRCHSLCGWAGQRPRLGPWRQPPGFSDAPITERDGLSTEALHNPSGFVQGCIVC
jgi:hypothetical protein